MGGGGGRSSHARRVSRWSRHDLTGVVSLSRLEVEDRRVRRPVGPVGVSFGGRSRGTLGGKVWVGGVATGGGVWLVGVVPFVVSTGGGEAVATLGVGGGAEKPSHCLWSIWVPVLGLG